MAINLKKEETENYVSFSDIDLETIKENKRIFLPYEKLPDSEEMRFSYLDRLISFIERETGKHCSYFFVNETEPYEVNGFYIQIASELKDRNGAYVNNNDFIYDNNGEKWHVSYYYRNNQPCIIVDNENGECKVVTSLSEFCLDYDEALNAKLDKPVKTSTNLPIFEIISLLVVLVMIIGGFTVMMKFASSVITEITTVSAEAKKSENPLLNDLISLFQPVIDLLKDNIQFLIVIPITIFTISYGIRTIRKFF